MTDEGQAAERPGVEPSHPSSGIPGPRVVRIGEHRGRPAEPPWQDGHAVRVAEAKRAFLRRVVAYLAADAGVSQFVDVGSRMPACVEIRDTAQGHDPRARVVYVETDPTVTPHDRGPGRDPAVPVVSTGGRDPAALLDHLHRRGLVDSAAPVAVLLSDTRWPGEAKGVRHLLHGLYGAVCSGSHVALAHETRPAGVGPPPSASDLFAPFAPLDPGLADLAWWPYPDDEVTAEGTGVPAGLARRA